MLKSITASSRKSVEVFSISTDTAYSHLAWHDTSPSIKSVSYPMIVDPTGKMCKEFGTYIEDEGLSLRGTFIIDTEGILRTIEIHSNSIGRNISETLRTLKVAVYVKEHPGRSMPCQLGARQEEHQAGRQSCRQDMTS